MGRHMLHRRFIFRQITRSGKQALVLVLCVMLSIVSLVSISGLGDSIRENLLKDARALHGGDIILHSRAQFSASLKAAVSRLSVRGEAKSLRVLEFSSVVLNEKKDASLLANIKLVGAGYPLYGKVTLASGLSFGQVLRPGVVVVEQVLLDRLHLSVGDMIRVGSAELAIRDVVVHEPDRPVSFFSFGPRIFIHMDDAGRLGLIGQGSRIEYTLLLKVAGQVNIEKIAGALRISAGLSERVETYRSARSRIKRFFDNFLFFLTLIAIFTLILSGIGIQSSLTALIREKRQSIAVMRAVGASGRFVSGHFIAVVALLGLFGTLLGVLFGYCLQFLMPWLFGGLLPDALRPSLSWPPVLQGGALGIFAVSLFAFVPLYRLREVKPVAVFRKDTAVPSKGVAAQVAVAALVVFFAGMILWRMEDKRTGAWLLLGVAGLIALSGLASQGLLWLLREISFQSLILRQALRGLHRPGNATRAILITLSASFSVIFCIYLIEKNLDASFVQSYPADAPNLFFIDIQPNQVLQFSEALGYAPRYYPLIRARLTAINDEKIDPEAERARRGDNLGRTFNLTYRDDLLDDEALSVGKTLFGKDIRALQVSVLDTVSEMHPISIGDRLRFNIQGLSVEATVSSIRTRTRESIEPFFYFVFPASSLLNDAPQTIFTAVRLPRAQIGAVQNRIAAAFPNVTPIDVTQIIADFAVILGKLTLVVRFFTALGIAAGVLIIVGSILATRLARAAETVYYKILGARRRFVAAVFALENLLIGLLSGLLGLLFSQAGAMIICVRIFKIDYRVNPGPSLLMLGGTMLMVAIVGLSASVSILRQRPMTVLREQTEE